MRSIFIYLHQIVYFVKQRKHFARFHVFLLSAAILTLSLLLLSQQTGTEGEENGNDPFGPELFAAQCASCHNLSEQHSIGPHLAAIIGRRSGRVPGYNTSAALTSLNIVWTRKNLAEFILNPSQFAPGTSMSAVGTTPAEAQSIADFLASTR